MTILIVDDHPLNLKLLRLHLEEAEHQVLEAADGVEALQVLITHPIELVISDILMPRMDGYHLCRTVRQDKRLRHLPFIFYTATYTSESDELLAMKIGADAYVRKPASGTDLLDVMDSVLSNARNPFSISPDEPLSPDVMRDYNEVLIRKLEQKNEELERAQAAIIRTNEMLEQRVQERTYELESANAELDAFCHSAAHDLRSPLRAVNGYCQILAEDYSDRLDEEGLEYLQRIREATRKMTSLIDELLNLSLVGRHEIDHGEVNLSELALAISQDLHEQFPEPPMRVSIQPDVVVRGDAALLSIALENIMNNAWKFTSKQTSRSFEFGLVEGEPRPIVYLRDNGPGFDKGQANRLFRPFQRLHSQQEYPGTGLGLTIVQRIMNRHAGTVRAESELGEGTTIYLEW